MPHMSILVTGGAGFVGAAIVKRLLETYSDYKITVLDIKPEQENIQRPESCSYFQVDLVNAEEVLCAVKELQPRVIVHTAGIIPAGASRYNRMMKKTVDDVNIQGTLNVLEAAKTYGVEALVYTSSCTVITDDLEHDFPNYNESITIPPVSLIYGESKAIAEGHVLEANSPALATCALRPSIIFGEEDSSMIPSVHACIAKGETPFTIGSNDNLYDFTYVANVADAHILAVKNLLTTRTAAGHAISITNGQPVTFRDFCLAIWAAFGHVPPYNILIPVSLAWFAGLMAEIISWLTGTPSALSRGSVKDAAGCRYADISKARKLLGYEPQVDLGEGLRRSCEAYKLRLKRKVS